MSLFKRIVIFTILGTMTLFFIHTLSVQASGSQAKIGPVDVSGMSQKEMRKETQKIVDVWQKNDIIIQIGRNEVTVSGEDFNFDVQQSVNDLLKKIDKPWYDFWSPTPSASVDLVVNETEKLRQKLQPILGDETDLQMKELLKQVALLPNRPLKIERKDFSFEEGIEISSASINLKEDEVESITQMTKNVNGVLVKPNQELSFFQQVGVPESIRLGSIMASALYQNALQSGFEIAERHQALLQQNYTNPGMEAVIKPSKQYDLKFIVSRDSSIKMRAEVEGNTLNVKFYIAAGEKKPDVKVYTADEESIPSGVIYRYNESLGAGVTESVQQAKDGLTISVYRQIRTEKGETKRTLMSNNYYAPIHEVIETSNEEVIVEEPVTQDSEVDSSFEVNEDTTEVPTEDDVVTPTPPPNEPTADELKNATVDYSEDEDYYYYIYSVEK